MEAILIYAGQATAGILALLGLWKDARDYGELSKKLGRGIVWVCALLLLILFSASIYLTHIGRQQAAKDRQTADKDRKAADRDRQAAITAEAVSTGKIEQLRQAMEDAQKVYLTQVAKLCPSPKSPKQLLIAQTEQYRDDITAFVKDRWGSFPQISPAEDSNQELSMAFEGKWRRYDAEIVKFFRESPYYRECLRITVELHKYNINSSCADDSSHLITMTATQFVETAKNLPGR
jgi:hypothetical protein